MVAVPFLIRKAIPYIPGSGEFTVGAIATITDDSKYNGWPQIVRMATGSLLMAYVKADNHNADNTGKIVGRIATEANALAGTWDAEFDIADETLGAINVSLVVLAGGRILCAYNLFDAPNTPTDSVRIRYSDDDGGTWSSAITVNSSFTSTVTNSSARMVQRADGAVLMTVYGLDSGETFYSAALHVSTDDGATWPTEILIADGQTDSRQYYEPSLTILSDGALRCLIRTSAGTGDMRQSDSTDGGATWSAPAVAFGGYSPANAIQLRSRTLLATVRGNAAAKLEAFSSVDRGATWVSQGILDNTSYTELEYACSVQLSTGQILGVYSVQPSVAITNADIKTFVITENAA